MNLGQRIAAWRRHRGMSQKQLAKAIGLSPVTVCMWERKKRGNTPLQGNLEAVVEALGLTMREFYGNVPKARARA